MKPAIIKINLHQNHPWAGWAADVWGDDELRVTGYGDTKAEAVEKAKGGHKLFLAAVRTYTHRKLGGLLEKRNIISNDIEVNTELQGSKSWPSGIPHEVGCTAEDYCKSIAEESND